MTVRVYTLIPNRLFSSARTNIMTQPEREAVCSPPRNVLAVVNLWHTKDLEMEALCRKYYHISIPDGKTLDQQVIYHTVGIVLRHIRCRESVLVHCYGGRNRAGLICSLVLREYFKISGKEASERFKAARPNSLFNQAFVSFLAGLPSP